MSSIISDTKLRYIVIFAILIASFLILQKIVKYFEYDSDGNVLVVINKDFLLSELFNYGEHRAEFPKRKLLYYKLSNYIIYKSLNLYIASGTNKQSRLKFNVTLVSNKKLKYLRQSLDKIVKKNKELS